MANYSCRPIAGKSFSSFFSRAWKVQRQFYLLTTLSAWAFSIAHLVIWTKPKWLCWKFIAFHPNIHECSSKTVFYSDLEKFGIICFLNFDWKLVLHIKGSFICSEGIKVKLDGDEEEIGLLKSLVKVIFFRESKLGQKCDICRIFSCQGQLNRWHCQSVSKWDFWFQQLQSTAELR